VSDGHDGHGNDREVSEAMETLSSELIEKAMVCGMGFTGAVLSMAMGRLLAMMEEPQVDKALVIHAEESRNFRSYFIRLRDGRGGSSNSGEETRQ
jgi:hypothetical protein